MYPVIGLVIVGQRATQRMLSTIHNKMSFFRNPSFVKNDLITGPREATEDHDSESVENKS
jgi:hypothetical protein